MPTTPQLRIIKEASDFHVYAFESPYENSIVQFCRSIKDKYGWKEFNWHAGKWRFSLPEIAQEIQLRFPDVELVEEEAIPPLINRINLARELSELDNSNIKGLNAKLYDYQRAGIEFLTTSSGRAMLCDDMGTGKTLQTLGYLVHNKINRTLVVCPASVKFAWENEVKKWTKLNPFVVDSKTSFAQIPHSINVVIINYDILKKHFNELMKYRWDCLVADESHSIKNTKAIRTKLTKQIASLIPKVILLSGTPMLNRPIELFSSLNILDPKTWNNWKRFSIRYCDGHQGRWGWETKGSTNIDELREKISPYFLRRTKADVLTQLPPKNYIDIPVDLESSVQRRYDEAEANLAKFLREYKKKGQEEIRRAMAAERLVKLNELRQLTTEGKVDSVVEIIDQLLDNEEKVVVFSVYNSPLEKLKERYGETAVILTGQTANEDRKSIIEAFQNDPEIKVFLGGTKAAGVGITLTAASNVVLIDFDWTPAIMAQAVDRCHRIGTKAESINIYQIYARDTIDSWMVELLSKKQALVSRLIDGQGTEEDGGSMVNNLFSNVEKKYEEPF